MDASAALFQIVVWFVAVVAAPLHAEAQQANFVQAISDLTAALEGT